jgi:ABC-type transport system involved in Fe-S cluster assembly fused permease/ATPase subunit
VDEEALKEAYLLTSDCILNYRTVQSFANTDKLIKRYEELLTKPSETSMGKAHWIGFWAGFSQFSQNLVFGMMYYLSSLLAKSDPGMAGENT